ncbi:hypothetical protein C1645_826802 [Glomus cerebriforme]|uniref:SWIM-type domain-containing protein n=1 Tax=Glomus cerebriforme TaxID=658196 RepID=A0A397SQ68_9GLOM|nr:hypothetical protein C1645_826802 [Glomus cerebriforme]
MVREDDYDQPQSLFSSLIEKISHNSIRQVWKVTRHRGQKSESQYIILLDDESHLCTCLWLINRGIVCPKQKYGFSMGYAKKALDLAIRADKENVISMYISDPLWVRHKGQQPNRYKSCDEPQKKKVRHVQDITNITNKDYEEEVVANQEGKKEKNISMDNYVKGKGRRITRLDESVTSYTIFLVSDYVKIHEENVVARKASNDVAETLVLLSEMEERANVTLRGVDEKNEEDEEDYRME